MKGILKVSMSLGLLSSLFALPVQGQDEVRQFRRTSVGTSLSNGLPVGGWENPRLQQELQLDKEQVDRLNALAEATFEELAEASRDYARNRDDESGKALLRRNEEIADRFEAQLSEILDADQFRRLREVSYQRLGCLALRVPAVQEALGLGDGQVAAVEAILRDYLAKQRASRGLDNSARDEMLSLANDHAMDELLDVLSDEQEATLRGLLGKPY